MSDRKHADPRRFAGFESIPVAVTVRVGGARCPLSRILELKPGDVIHLERSIGQPFELIADGHLLAEVEPLGRDEGIAVKVVAVPEDDDDPAR